jgi:hypothetical protein
MSNSVVPLIVAVVGVCGTLASAIFTQQLTLKARLRELEHAERRQLAEQEAAGIQQKADQLRACYVQVNANHRNYRDAMLAFAHALKEGSPGDAEEAELATARRSQRDARGEAQMMVSDAVLDAEGEVAQRLNKAYRKLMLARRESDAGARDSTLDEAISLLSETVPLLSHARTIMRMELGLASKPPQ